MPHISIPARDREDGDVTYPCQRDGPEGYDSPVPASDMQAHQTQERAWQANKRTTTHTHTASFRDKEILLTEPKANTKKNSDYLFLI